MRKSQLKHPKFFLFDLGVKRALERSLDQGISPDTSGFGRAFEHFVICEAYRLNEYSRTDFKFSHFQTTMGAEVDLVLSQGRSVLAVEIKSSERIDEVELRRFSRNSEALKPATKYWVSRDPVASKIEDVHCLHWRDFLAEVFQKPNF